MVIIKIEEIIIIIIVDGIILVMGIFMEIIMEIIEGEIQIIEKELIIKNILLEIKGEIIVRVLNQVLLQVQVQEEGVHLMIQGDIQEDLVNLNHLLEVEEVNQGLITREVKAEVQDLCHLLV